MTEKNDFDEALRDYETDGGDVQRRNRQMDRFSSRQNVLGTDRALRKRNGTLQMDPWDGMKSFSGTLAVVWPLHWNEARLLHNDHRFPVWQCH